MRSPFFIEIYDKAMKRVGFIGDPAEIKVTPRHGAVGEASFTIRNDHTRAPLLMAAGARVRITYSGVDSEGAPWTERLISGPVRGVGGNGAARTLTFRVDDDARLLGRVLGWPAPTQPITNQGATSAYRTITGPAESVLKSFVTENAVTRLGLPVVCATNQNRGATITVKMRMHPLADRLLPAVLQAGVGFTVDQQVGGQRAEAGRGLLHAGRLPRSLTEASGVVTSYDYDLNAPTVTRGVVGAQGEGTGAVLAVPGDPAVGARG